MSYREAKVSLGITALELSSLCVCSWDNTKLMKVAKFSFKSQELAAVK